MENNFVIELIKSNFDMEISNNILFLKNQIFVILADGTKAKISTKKVA